MTPDSDASWEQRLRHRARRNGLQLRKSRRRDPTASDFGAYYLVDQERNFGLFGKTPLFSLGEVERALDELEAREPSPGT